MKKGKPGWWFNNKPAVSKFRYFGARYPERVVAKSRKRKKPYGLHLRRLNWTQWYATKQGRDDAAAAMQKQPRWRRWTYDYIDR